MIVLNLMQGELRVVTRPQGDYALLRGNPTKLTSTYAVVQTFPVRDAATEYAHKFAVYMLREQESLEE